MESKRWKLRLNGHANALPAVLSKRLKSAYQARSARQSAKARPFCVLV